MSRASKRLACKANHRCFWLTFCEKDDPAKSCVTASGIYLIAHPLVKPIAQPQLWSTLPGDLTTPLPVREDFSIRVQVLIYQNK